MKERIPINYKPLWKLMIDKNITKSQLRNETGIAPSTFTRMGSNEYVSLDILLRISAAMHCSLDDIIEVEDQ